VKGLQRNCNHLKDKNVTAAVNPVDAQDEEYWEIKNFNLFVWYYLASIHWPVRRDRVLLYQILIRQF